MRVLEVSKSILGFFVVGMTLRTLRLVGPGIVPMSRVVDRAHVLGVIRLVIEGKIV
jgi:hypothetical protein